MTDVEARLRQTLDAVAECINPDDTPLPRPGPDQVAARRTLRPALIAAVILIVVALAGAVVWRTNSSVSIADRSVTAGPSPTTTPTDRDPILRVAGGDIVVKLMEIPSADDRWCVELTSTSPPTGVAPDICIVPGTPGIAVERVTIGRRTVIYGLGAFVSSFAGSMAEVSVPLAQQEAPFGPVRAFAMIWDGPDVNGVIFGAHVSPSESSLTAVVGTGLPGFEPNPISPLPVDVPFDDRMLFAYKHQGQVWAILDSGANVHLTGGRVTGYPFVAPDGHTVVFGRDSESLFAELVALDVRTGADRAIGAAASIAFAEDGRLAIVPPIDDEVPHTLVILRPGSFDAPTEITLGADNASHGLAWAADGRTILINSSNSGGVGTRLSLVDIASKSVTPLTVDSAPTETIWRLDRGMTARGWPALRYVDGRSQIGYLKVTQGRGTYSGVDMKVATPEAALSMANITGFASVGRVTSQLVADAHFTFRPADIDAFVVADEEEVFLVTEKGELTYLLSDARGASAP